MQKERQVKKMAHKTDTNTPGLQHGMRDGRTLAFLAAASALTWLGVRRLGVRGPTDWLEVVDLGVEGVGGRGWG